MEFKQLNEKKTPKNKVVGKVINSSVNCASPFRFLPNFSTPPSRFTKIRNPFEAHLMERLHLPTFSPTVFSPMISTPDKKFKWTIEDVSILKPADIDESTIEQHVSDHDLIPESVVQEKIERFFNEKSIVPSPMTQIITRTPLLPIMEEERHFCEVSVQTVLTLPPILPEHVEEVLKPYFTHTQDQQQPVMNIDEDTSLYRQLFVLDDESQQTMSPNSLKDLSPITLSPLNPLINDDPSFGSPSNYPQLRECVLSPISRDSPRHSRSACRLSFSGNMSLDSSVMVVPDVAQQTPDQTYISDAKHQPPELEVLSDSTINWDMDYKLVSLTPSENSTDSDSNKMDVSTSSTPHSKIFTSQRKRLSDSFKDEDDVHSFGRDKYQCYDEVIARRGKSRLFRDDYTDAGYHTGSLTICDESVYKDDETYLFASTPTKHKN